MSPSPNRNVLWARALADELARHGLVHVCVGSGSRCAPLVEAVAADGRFTVHPHVDERSAAFFALGIGAASGTPAAVITTSGTAAVNLFPAVVEASQSDVGLLAITADRPAGLRGLDANQTIDQVRLFGGYARLAVDLPPPRAAADDLARLRVAAARIWAAAAGPPAGPVHLNVPLEKPLEPTPIAGDVPDGLEAPGARGAGRPDGRPYTVVAGPAHAGGAAPALVESLADRLRAARRPLFVCGPTARPGAGPAALAAAAARRAPVIADPLSGARFHPLAPGVVPPHADGFLGADRVAAALAPDLVVRVGPLPTSSTVGAFLARHAGVETIVLDDGWRWKDHLATATDRVCADPTATLTALAARLEGDPGSAAAGRGWTDRWIAAGEAAREALAPALEDPALEGAVAARVARALPAGATWFVGNSMPIRDVDTFAAPRPVALRALGFRGASGIDGNVSGALGAAVARGEPAAALLGDLTLLHDAGALLCSRPVPVPIQIVVVQNHGGGIFHMLPVRDFDPPFTPYVVMPHTVDLAAVAAAARIPHRLPATLDELEAALDEGWGSAGVRLIEFRTDRVRNMEARRTAIAAAAEAAGAALS